MSCNSCSKELVGKQTKWCSDQCRINFYVSKSRRERKKKLIEYFGGKCILCGYDKCVAALHFHHLDKTAKEFGVGSGHTRSWERDLEEAEKCILICANCHAEQHWA